jgi:hypothetical protein
LRQFIYSSFLIVLLMFGMTSASNANNNVQFFPPRGCESNEMMVLGWDGKSQTQCLSGQDLFTRLSYPSCAEGQTLVYHSFGRTPVNISGDSSLAGFYCENNTASGIYPTCADGEFLTNEMVDGSIKLVCKTAGASAQECKPVVSSKPTCVTRYANMATKIACGFSSDASCKPGETAISGGASGMSNIALQNSAPILDGSGNAVGWHISAVDTWAEGCTINSSVADGTTASGNAPNFPFAGGTSKVGGQAVAICCTWP